MSSLQFSLASSDPRTDYFFTCLKVNIFLYAVISFLCVVCLAGKFYSGSLWLIRSRSTPTGTLWLPNSTVLYCFWICYFATMCEVFCALTMRVYGPGGGDPRTLQAITGAVRRISHLERSMLTSKAVVAAVRSAVA